MNTGIFGNWFQDHDIEIFFNWFQDHEYRDKNKDGNQQRVVYNSMIKQ